ncbi:hypothetical protein D4764_15G0005820 [Takifugu flavidus]|uniref:Ig-like domain-containing protein n=1 Tax=Takifugu flavidus TaxID=433684 RepID=A0A5C6P213_9TELE|nr:hypothetical protein D4764_15G0005820 [Takifugu flavidus]
MTQEEVCSSVSNHVESRKSCQKRTRPPPNVEHQTVSPAALELLAEMEPWLWILLAALCFETTWGQKISPVPGMKNGISSREGEDVTLRCNYETSSSGVYLYWYKHQSDYEAPQFILWKGARSYTGQENIPDKRYRCNTGQQESELTITDVTLADSAVYYCALRATETQRDEDAVQKPDKSYLTDHRQVHCSLSDTGYRDRDLLVSGGSWEIINQRVVQQHNSDSLWCTGGTEVIQRSEVPWH